MGAALRPRRGTRGLVALAALTALCLPAARAQQAAPRIASGGVVNAASFYPPEVPGSALAAGSIFAVFGRDFASASASADAFPLGETLGGVSLEVRTVDGEVFRPLPLYVSPTQINAILPSAVPVGEHELVVDRAGLRSAAARFKTVRTSVGLFTERFWGYRSVPGADLRDPLRPGGVLTLWATGLGPIDSLDAAAPPVGDLPANLTVKIGHQTAVIEYQGRAPCCAGLDQINVRVPEDASLGCFTPVWVELNGSLFSNVAVFPAAPADADCWAGSAFPDNPPGASRAGRVVLETDVSGALPQSSGWAEFVQTADERAQRPFAIEDPAFLPPSGTCLSVFPAGDSSTEPSPLDAGPAIVAETPAGAYSLIPADPGGRYALPNPPAEFPPGEYAFSSDGGAGFPAFTAQFETLQDAPLVSLVLGSLSTVADDPEERGYFLCNRSSQGESAAYPEAVWANLPGRIGEERLLRGFGAALDFAEIGNGSGLAMVQRVSRSDLTGAFPPVQLPSTPVRLPNGVEIQAEIAANSSEHQRGLMGRPVLLPGRGMLFLFDRPGPLRFWMRGTLIALDVVFLDENREITAIFADRRPCPDGGPCPFFGPETASRYVLEVGAGEAERFGLRPGQRLDW